LNALNKPIGKASKGKQAAGSGPGSSFGSKLTKWSAIGLVALVVAAGSLVILTDNPDGGEPNAVAKLETTGSTLNSQNVGVLTIPDAGPARIGLPDGLSEASSGDQTATLSEISPQPSEPTNNDIIIRRVEDGVSSFDTKLSHLPEPSLIESSVYGDLPITAPDGLTPLEAYARPAGASGGFGTARVAIIVGGLGLSQTGTQSAIEKLPGSVTLAFAPYGNSLSRWVERARSGGHEIILQTPLEPFDYPVNDPGPHTLRVDLDAAENTKRLHWVLGRITNYVGIMNFMGARFSSNANALSPMMKELRQRGLMYLDDGSALRSEAGNVAQSMGVPFAKSAIQLDANPDSAQVQAQLLKLEQMARDTGVAVATASAFPASVRRIAEWVEAAEKKGIDVVPISALAAVDIGRQLGQR
jgi:hypothetical protein